MRSKNLSRETYNLVGNLLPDDEFYHALVDCKKTPGSYSVSQEILESGSFVLSLGTEAVLTYNEPKHFHLLSVVEAAWRGRSETEIQKMIALSTSDKSSL